MEHKIVAVDVRENTVIYQCKCGQTFIGPGMDSYHGAKLPDPLIEHLEKQKRR